jgi:hypothetical protein
MNHWLTAMEDMVTDIRHLEDALIQHKQIAIVLELEMEEVLVQNLIFVVTILWLLMVKLLTHIRLNIKKIKVVRLEWQLTQISNYHTTAVIQMIMLLQVDNYHLLLDGLVILKFLENIQMKWLQELQMVDCLHLQKNKFNM